MSLNVVMLSGNLTRDTELRSTTYGTSILTFGIAVNERVKRGEDWVDEPNFFEVVVFGKRAESLSRIMHKGMKVALTGRLKYSSWEKDGQKRSKVEVIADNVDLMQRRDGQSGRESGSYGSYSSGDGYSRQNGSQGVSDVYDDDILF